MIVPRAFVFPSGERGTAAVPSIDGVDVVPASPSDPTPRSVDEIARGIIRPLLGEKYCYVALRPWKSSSPGRDDDDDGGPITEEYLLNRAHWFLPVDLYTTMVDEARNLRMIREDFPHSERYLNDHILNEHLYVATEKALFCACRRRGDETAKALEHIMPLLMFLLSEDLTGFDSVLAYNTIRGHEPEKFDAFLSGFSETWRILLGRSDERLGWGDSGGRVRRSVTRLLSLLQRDVKLALKVDYHFYEPTRIHFRLTNEECPELTESEGESGDEDDDDSDDDDDEMENNNNHNITDDDDSTIGPINL
eukprot:CAMPEP_0197198020 /NCGR_PEP_ID=MMETSP1423-20130617/33163_1 /TAXON_ID=476441 /ORGANISM="Pseudo-nitzschia heimii, Strain UNC1101" /LENGTH=306 /DNA_ID=CAMNT_0042651849 /DNA_START=129 /DNA_END=1049 /DNA_ORIENTATION=-